MKRLVILLAVIILSVKLNAQKIVNLTEYSIEVSTKKYLKINGKQVKTWGKKKYVAIAPDAKTKTLEFAEGSNGKVILTDYSKNKNVETTTKYVVWRFFLDVKDPSSVQWILFPFYSPKEVEKSTPLNRNSLPIVEDFFIGRSKVEVEMKNGSLRIGNIPVIEIGLEGATPFQLYREMKQDLTYAQTTKLEFSLLSNEDLSFPERNLMPWAGLRKDHPGINELEMICWNSLGRGERIHLTLFFLMKDQGKALPFWVAESEQ